MSSQPQACRYDSAISAQCLLLHMKTTITGSACSCSGSMFRYLHTSQNFRNTELLLVCKMSRTIFLLQTLCALENICNKSVDTSKTHPTSPLTCILSTCPYTMLHNIVNLQCYRKLFNDHRTRTVLRICGGQTAAAITLLAVLANTTNFFWKMLCSVTIVHMQAWLLLRALKASAL